MNRIVVGSISIALIAAIASVAEYYAFKSKFVDESAQDLGKLAEVMETVSAGGGLNSAVGLWAPRPSLALKKGTAKHGIYEFDTDKTKRDSKKYIFEGKTEFGPIVGMGFGKYNAELKLKQVKGDDSFNKLIKKTPVVIDLSKSLSDEFKVSMRPIRLKADNETPDGEKSAAAVEIGKLEAVFDGQAQNVSFVAVIPKFEIATESGGLGASLVNLEGFKVMSKQTRAKGGVYVGPSSVKLGKFAFANLVGFSDLKITQSNKPNGEGFDSRLTFNADDMVWLGKEYGSMQGGVDLLGLSPKGFKSLIGGPGAGGAFPASVLGGLSQSGLASAQSVRLKGWKWQAGMWESTLDAEAVLSQGGPSPIESAELSLSISPWQMIATLGDEERAPRYLEKIEGMARSGVLIDEGDGNYSAKFKFGKAVAPNNVGPLTGQRVEINGRQMVWGQAVWQTSGLIP